MLAAVRDPRRLWRIAGGGRCLVAADGGNHWQPGPDSNQSYLAAQTPPDEMARLIDGLMAGPPSGL